MWVNLTSFVRHAFCLGCHSIDVLSEIVLDVTSFNWRPLWYRICMTSFEWPYLDDVILLWVYILLDSKKAGLFKPQPYYDAYEQEGADSAWSGLSPSHTLTHTMLTHTDHTHHALTLCSQHNALTHCSHTLITHTMLMYTHWSHTPCSHTHCSHPKITHNALTHWTHSCSHTQIPQLIFPAEHTAALPHGTHTMLSPTENTAALTHCTHIMLSPTEHTAALTHRTHTIYHPLNTHILSPTDHTAALPHGTHTMLSPTEHTAALTHRSHSCSQVPIRIAHTLTG